VHSEREQNMKNTPHTEKTTHHKSGGTGQHASAGPRGAALAPHAYGIESLDRATAEAGSHNRTGLPDALKTGIESLSGLALDDVRVHYNSPQPKQLQALAYTQGTEIHVGPGQEKHLPHEAWHVVQQAQGRVQPTMQMKDGVRVNDDTNLEREATVMGTRAFQLKSSSETGTVQRKASSHAKSCGCPACAPGVAATVQKSSIQTGEILQLKCDTCGSEDHTWKKCPLFADEAEAAPAEESKQVVAAPVKKKGWQKGSTAPTGNYKNTTGHHDPTLAKWRKKSVKSGYGGKLGVKP
jgi:hypothetical protein